MTSERNPIVICRHTLKALYYLTLWPNQKKEKNPGRVEFLKGVLVMLSSSMWLIFGMMHAYVTYTNRLNVDLTEDVILAFTCCCTYYNIFNFLRKQPKVSLLLQDLSTFKNVPEPQNFKEEVKRQVYFSKCMDAYATTLVVFAPIWKLIHKPGCDRLNEEFNLNETCGLVTRLYLPFNFRFWPVFALIVFCGGLFAMIVIKGCYVTLYIVLEIGQHIVFRMKHLNSLIVECFEEEKPEDRKVKLGKCVAYHVEIIEFVNRLNDCFSSSIFVTFGLAVVIIAIVEKELLEHYNTMFASIHIVEWTLLLFIISYGGHNILYTSSIIPDAIWSTKWYSATPSERRVLNLMLMMSQRNLSISAGLLGELSLTLYLSLLKATYSFMCFFSS